MRKVLLTAIAFYLITLSSATKSQHRDDFFINSWFAPDGEWGYGSRPASETPCSSMYPFWLGNQHPYCTLDPDPGGCLCNSERICSALFSTYFLQPDVPLTYAGDLVFGEYKFDESN